ncbi:MAG: Gfo/Idh/MocA family oxidoreductase [Lacipirellulaceae bacterium]
MSQPSREGEPGCQAVGSSRREFLAAAAVTGGVLAAGLPTARAAHASGDHRLRVGVIGCGGRGRGAASDALKAGADVAIVALSDAFADRVEEAERILAEEHPGRVDVPKERQFVGFDAYKQVLESDCDLVILATPPGFRPRHFEAAVESGKHVFMEKPVAVDAPGIRRVLEAGKKAQEKRLAVGVGLQRRHESHYQETVKRLQDGAIGDILLTRTYWNQEGLWVRNREPQQSEMEYQMRNWYYFNWLCGDHIVEQHIHNLDVSNWVKNAVPVKANGMGGREVRKGRDHGQIFDHHAVEFTYPDGSTMMSQCRHMAGCWSSVDEHAHGSKGSCHVGAGRILGADGKAIWRHKGPKPAGYVQEHIDLQKAIRDNAPYNETGVGAHSTMTAILGRMATYSGRAIGWDEALASNLSLTTPEQVYAFDATPPVTPDADGRYPVPVPGVTQVV